MVNGKVNYVGNLNSLVVRALELVMGRAPTGELGFVEICPRHRRKITSLQAQPASFHGDSFRLSRAALVAVRVSSLSSNYASVYEMIFFMLIWMVVLLKWFEQRSGTDTSWQNQIVPVSEFLRWTVVDDVTVVHLTTLDICYQNRLSSIHPLHNWGRVCRQLVSYSAVFIWLTKKKTITNPTNYDTRKLWWTYQNP